MSRDYNILLIPVYLCVGECSDEPSVECRILQTLRCYNTTSGEQSKHIITYLF